MRIRSTVGVCLTLLAVLMLSPVSGVSQTEGDYLYNVKMLRAAPGEWNQMVEAIVANAIMTEEAGDMAPYWMRHSQGDQWDFMLIYPMESTEAFFSADRIEKRASVWGSEDGLALAAHMEAITAYQEEWFANSVSVEEMGRRFEGMNFYHVEMFAGLPGKREELLEQRRMENRYYTHLDRQLNLLFVRVAGGNWDAMTIGFYENLQAFANGGAGSSAADQEEAARVAGFDGTSDIGPYLRSLLSYHNDTLAVRVR